MCTYKISIDDSLLEQVKSLFPSEAEINSWIQSQLEDLLLQLADNNKHKKPQKDKLSTRLRGIAKAPEGFDYKKELAERY